MIDAVDAFADAVCSIGGTVHDSPDAGIDVVIDIGGRTFAVQVRHVRTATPSSLGKVVDGSDQQDQEVIRVLVSERIPEGARDLLRSRGWGWLDLRGHLHLAGPGLLVDANVPALTARPERSTALAGPAGVEVAALLLLDPERTPGVRAVARELRRSPSTVSEIFAALRREGLLTEDGRVAHRDLFWQVAEVWRGSATALAAAPEPGDAALDVALSFGLDDVESAPGWALTDTRAAALYGAPVGVRGDHPPDFYVPTQRILHRAVRLLGRAADSSERRATLRVAPVPMIADRRIDAVRHRLGDERWPLAHPFFVALDLAADPGRGREILENWTPPEPWPRVW